jgi:hypothetical protein
MGSRCPGVHRGDVAPRGVDSADGRAVVHTHCLAVADMRCRRRRRHDGQLEGRRRRPCRGRPCAGTVPGAVRSERSYMRPLAAIGLREHVEAREGKKAGEGKEGSPVEGPATPACTHTCVCLLANSASASTGCGLRPIRPITIPLPERLFWLLRSSCCIRLASGCGPCPTLVAGLARSVCLVGPKDAECPERFRSRLLCSNTHLGCRTHMAPRTGTAKHLHRLATSGGWDVEALRWDRRCAALGPAVRCTGTGGAQHWDRHCAGGVEALHVPGATASASGGQARATR